MKANYTYLSDGTKAAAYTSASAGKDYVGSFVYARSTNGSKTLESVAFGGGRIRKNGSSYLVDYHVTDHLGSVRAMIIGRGNLTDYIPITMGTDKATGYNLEFQSKKFAVTVSEPFISELQRQGIQYSVTHK